MAIHQDTSRDTGSVQHTCAFILNTATKKCHRRPTVHHLYLMKIL